MLEVDGRPRLAPVGALEHLGQWAHRVAVDALDLDHLGPEVRQQPGAVGRGEERGEVDEAQAGQRGAGRGIGGDGDRRRRQSRRPPAVATDLVAVLVERRRRPGDRARRRRQQHRRADDLDRPQRGVVEGGDDAGVADLFVVEGLARLADGEGGDLVLPQQVQPLLARPAAQDAGQALLHDLQVAVGEQARHLHRALHLGDLVTESEDLHRPVEGPGGAGVDLDQPAVGALVHPQEQPLVAEPEVARAALLVDRRLPVLGPPVHRVEREGAVAQRHVDVVAAAGADAAAQAGQRADGRQHRGGVVERGVAEEDGTVPAPAPLVHDAEVGGDGGVEAGAVAVGRVLAVAGDRRVHDGVVAGGDVVVAEAPPGHHAGPVVLDDDVGAGGEIGGDPALVGIAQVEGHAALAAVPQRVAAGAPQQAVGPVLDEDDVGAVVGQHHRRQRAGHAVRQREHAHAGQGALGQVRLLFGHVVVPLRDFVS